PEVLDGLRIVEVRQLSSFGPVDRLKPDVIDAVFFDDKGQKFAVRRKVEPGTTGRPWRSEDGMQRGIEVELTNTRTRPDQYDPPDVGPGLWLQLAGEQGQRFSLG